jgi:hypothetical protein
MNHIRREIPFVNYVIDRKEADVHVLVTRQTTGGGGLEFTAAFLGSGLSAPLGDTLVFVTRPGESEDAVRRKMVQVLKLGFIPFCAHTPVAMDLDIGFSGDPGSVEESDRWNHWVFRASLGGWMNGESSQRSGSFRGSVSANRITENWKIRTSASARFNENRYTVDEQTVVSSTRSRSFEGLAVKSLSGHWSAGVSADAYASTYSNLKGAVSLAPALEYNVFPYSESTRRELRILYELGGRFVRYNELTIYGKLKEPLAYEHLGVSLEVKQPWGTVETDVYGSHYLHDIRKNHVTVNGEVSLKLFKGFSFDLDGGFSMIHDQLSLPQRNATAEEILLQRRQLATQYDYWLSAGIEYSFGSIFNNVVNSRFGG